MIRGMWQERRGQERRGQERRCGIERRVDLAHMRRVHVTPKLNIALAVNSSLV